jgi:hypothetical protein
VRAAGPAEGAALARRIDEHLARPTADPREPLSPRSDDAEFLRRVVLDVTGRLPTAERSAAFLDDPSPGKRAALVEELLADPGYGRRLAQYWTELFVKRDGESNRRLKPTEFRTWLAARFQEGAGWDRIVARLIAVDEVGPEVFFLQANRASGERPSPAKVVGTVGSLFLGRQLQCAECHDHPYEPAWKHEDFWGLAAFLGRTRFERGAAKGAEGATEADFPPPPPDAKNKKTIVLPTFGTIEIPDPLDAKLVKGTATAKYLGGPAPEITEKGPYRPLFAAWVVSAENPWFDRAAANRLWSVFFARGLVDPLDDMHGKNPGTHPELLALLAREFRDSGCDVRHLVRGICLSDAYQRSSRAVSAEQTVAGYARMPVKFVQGETLLECLDQVLGVEPPSNVKKTKEEKDAEKAVVPNSDLFDTAEYDGPAAHYSFGPPQMLRLMNSELPRRIPSAAARIVAGAESDEARLDRLFLTVLARRPTSDERTALSELVRRSETPQAAAEAVLWILLCSAEFVSNH